MGMLNENRGRYLLLLLESLGHPDGLLGVVLLALDGF